MEVKEFTDKEEWDKFLASQKRSQFLQSYNWGDFKRGLGLRIWHLAILKENNVVGLCLLLKSPLPLHNNYLYAPRGPVLNLNLSSEELSEVYELLLNKIKEIARKENSIFLKIEPSLEKPYNFNFEKLGFHEAKTIQPPDTVILDLEKSEEKLLGEMHHKTRYNIRLARKKGVKIEFSEDKNDINTFYGLLQEVNKREKITSFSKNYYQKMFEVFEKDKAIKIVKAIYKGKIIVVNLVIYFGDMLTYNHGASSQEFRNVMASHLAQWETIVKARNGGYKYYDLRGIAPHDDSKHKWAGITRFKKSFGGKVVHYLGAYDFVFKPFLYQLYLLGKKLR